MLLQFIAYFFSCVCFAIIFNAPKKELAFCGIVGLCGKIVYTLLHINAGSSSFAVLSAALAIAAFARILSYNRKAPSTLYLIPGILPLAPGVEMYHTMQGVLFGDMLYTYIQGVETIKIAGLISLGIVVIFSLPQKVFAFGSLKK